jgi:hypothetical protein
MGQHDIKVYVSKLYHVFQAHLDSSSHCLSLQKWLPGLEQQVVVMVEATGIYWVNTASHSTMVRTASIPITKNPTQNINSAGLEAWLKWYSAI